MMMNRNDFFRVTGRILFLGGFALTGIYLAANKKISTDESCNMNGFCQKCSRLSGCKLPEAIKLRTDGKK